MAARHGRDALPPSADVVLSIDMVVFVPVFAPRQFPPEASATVPAAPGCDRSTLRVTVYSIRQSFNPTIQQSHWAFILNLRVGNRSAMGCPVARLARAPPQARSSQSESLTDRGVASTMSLNLKKIPALPPRRSCPVLRTTYRAELGVFTHSVNPSIPGALKASDPTYLPPAGVGSWLAGRSGFVVRPRGHTTRV